MADDCYYTSGGKQYGPVSSETLKALVANGQVRADDLVWKEGMLQWVKVRRIKGFAAAVDSQSKATASAPAPPPLPTTRPERPLPSQSLSQAGTNAVPSSTQRSPAQLTRHRMIAAGVAICLCLSLGLLFAVSLRKQDGSPKTTEPSSPLALIDREDESTSEAPSHNEKRSFKAEEGSFGKKEERSIGAAPPQKELSELTSSLRDIKRKLEHLPGARQPQNVTLPSPQRDNAKGSRTKNATASGNEPHNSFNPEIADALILAAVQMGKGAAKWAYINRAGENVITLDDRTSGATNFSDGLAPVRFGSYWGYIDRRGKYVIPPRFTLANPFFEGRATVRIGSNFSIIDRSGEVIASPGVGMTGPYSSGLACFFPSGGGKNGFIDRQGRVVIRPCFLPETLVFSEGLLCARLAEDNKWVILDPSGVEAAPSRNWQFNELRQYSEGVVAAEIAGKVGWGYMDRDGKLVIPPNRTWSKVGDFHDGRAAVSVSHESWGFIDKSGAVVIEPAYHSTDYFSNGLAAVKKAGRWGFIDKAGQVVVPLRYSSDNWRRFNNGMAAVRLDAEEWGYIDSSGKNTLTAAYAAAGDFVDCSDREPAPDERPFKIVADGTQADADGSSQGGPPYVKDARQTVEHHAKSLQMAALGRLWETRLECHSIAFRPDGGLLAIGGAVRPKLASWEGTVLIVNPATGRTVSAMQRLHGSYVDAITFSSNGDWLATGSYDGTVKLWTTSPPGEVSAWEMPSLVGRSPPPVTGLAFDPTGQKLVVVGGLFDAIRGSEVGSLGFHQRLVISEKSSSQVTKPKEPLTAVASLPGIGYVTASQGGLVTLWSTEGQQHSTFQAFPEAYRCVLGASKDGAYVAVAKTQSGSEIKVWDVNGRRFHKTLDAPRRSDDLSRRSEGIGAVAFSPDVTLCAAGDSRGIVRIWSVKSGELLATLTGHMYGIQALAFAPSGNMLVTGSAEKDNHGEVYAWSVQVP